MYKHYNTKFLIFIIDFNLYWFSMVRICGKIECVKKGKTHFGGKGKRPFDHIIHIIYPTFWSHECLFVLFTLCVGLSRVDSGTPGGFNNDGGGPQQSGSVSLSLSAADATPSGSPDPSSLTVLQPANNNQNNGTVYAAAAPTMLPGFTTHYTTTGKSTITRTRARASYDRITKVCLRSSHERYD